MNLSQFKSIFPECKSEEWVNLLNDHLHLHGIIEPEQIAMFLAQCGHESAGFTVLEENLNYSADGLLKTFPKYFKLREEAVNYHRMPSKIANRVYSNRMGNGDEASGEGWKFRGRGIIQLTGKDNYKKCSLGIYNDLRLLDNPDQLMNKEQALASALWFWDSKSLSTNDSIAKVTKIINGGSNGLQSRIELYNKIIQVLHN